MALKIIAGTILGIWLLLILLGKGGLVHILLLTSIGISFVEALRMYRTALKA